MMDGVEEVAIRSTVMPSAWLPVPVYELDRMWTGQHRMAAIAVALVPYCAYLERRQLIVERARGKAGPGSRPCWPRAPERPSSRTHPCFT